MRIYNSVIILFLLLISSYSNGQKPEKKDTKIIVVPADTLNLFNRVSVTLYENGYSIETKDEQLRFISSTEKTIGSRSIKIRALIKDSTITFTGQVANNVSFSLGGIKVERAFVNVYYGGMKGSDLRIAWEEIESFAKRFGSQISYSK